jgi:hypothetical protein
MPFERAGEVELFFARNFWPTELAKSSLSDSFQLLSSPWKKSQNRDAFNGKNDSVKSHKGRMTADSDEKIRRPSREPKK